MIKVMNSNLKKKMKEQRKEVNQKSYLKSTHL